MIVMKWVAKMDLAEEQNRGKAGIGAEWFTTADTTLINSSRNFFNVDECNLYTKGNACGAIAIVVIESTYFTMDISK